MTRVGHRRHGVVRPGGRRGADERGVILVLTAVAMFFILAVSALVLDGSAAYSQRRQGQNAADDAAMAGARQLYNARFGSPPAAAATVAALVADVAGKNGSSASTCTVVQNDIGHTAIGSCSVLANITDARAGGVRVAADIVRTTAFGAFVGIDTLTATTTATATFQPLAGTGSPFIICGGALDGYGILDPDGTVNVARATALGTIDLQSSQLPTCQAGAAFKGKADPSSRFSIPGNYNADQGNGSSTAIFDQVVSATPCTTTTGTLDCDMLIPIADHGDGSGSGIIMHLVALTVWHVVGRGVGNPKYGATFVGTQSLVTSGRGSTGVPANGTVPVVVKLVE